MDKTLILNSIKERENIKTNKAFAEFLGIKATTLAMWYKRNSFDIELIFKKCEYLNPEWLLTGKGDMLKNESNGVSQNVTGSNVTMVGGSVVGSSVSANNTANQNEIKAFKDNLKACEKIIQEKDKEIERLKKQIDKLFKMID